MNHPHQISNVDSTIQNCYPPRMLLPTKVNELRSDDGNTIAYEAFPRGQTSRWTAQPVLQWIESLAAATEDRDRLGPVIVGGFKLSDKIPPAVLPLRHPSVSLPHVSDDAVCNWDLTSIDYRDPMAWMYTRQIESLAGHFEEVSSINSRAPISPVPTAEKEKMDSSYRTIKTRLEFTFDRIIGQYLKKYPRDMCSGTDISHAIDPPSVNTEGGEIRALLDTLYEETIQKLKKLIADQQIFQQRGSSVVVPEVKCEYVPSQASVLEMPVHQQHQQQSKQELAKYMTSWLRTNWTNPYPDDDGLVVMATHCATTIQVISNWLINARTRKWRPAIIKASELGRPADLLLEDSINIFDGKPLREINPIEFSLKPQKQHQQQQDQHYEGLMNDYHDNDFVDHKEEMGYEDSLPNKRFRSNY